MHVTGAHHTGLSVVDLDRSLAFYALLGCDVIWQREIREEYFGRIVGIDNCVVRAAHLRIPGSGHVVELFEYVPHDHEANLVPKIPGHAHIAFTVDDLRSAYQELKAHGVRFFSEPVLITAGVNKGGYGVYLLDPNGITLELFQPPAA